MGLDMYFGIEVHRFATEPVRRYGPLKLRLDGCTMQYGFEYFRKFNALHNWMVQNVQHGQDDCETYPIEKEHFEKLLQDAETVLNDRSLAESVFPTADGFFFGSTEYDDYYYDALERVSELCKSALAILEDPKKSLGDVVVDCPGDVLKRIPGLATSHFRFTYQSSW